MLFMILHIQRLFTKVNCQLTDVMYVSTSTNYILSLFSWPPRAWPKQDHGPNMAHMSPRWNNKSNPCSCFAQLLAYTLKFVFVVWYFVVKLRWWTPITCISGEVFILTTCFCLQLTIAGHHADHIIAHKIPTFLYFTLQSSHSNSTICVWISSGAEPKGHMYHADYAAFAAIQCKKCKTCWAVPFFIRLSPAVYKPFKQSAALEHDIYPIVASVNLSWLI